MTSNTENGLIYIITITICHLLPLVRLKLSAKELSHSNVSTHADLPEDLLHCFCLSLYGQDGDNARILLDLHQIKLLMG